MKPKQKLATCSRCTKKRMIYEDIHHLTWICPLCNNKNYAIFKENNGQNDKSAYISNRGV